MGEKLDVPPYALKRLVNHSLSNDMTGRCEILREGEFRFALSILCLFVFLFTYLKKLTCLSGKIDSSSCPFPQIRAI
jgi:hypothetical protein